jgi:hypothetical protein
VRLAVYFAVVSVAYALLALFVPVAAEVLMIAFVALLLVPLLVFDYRHGRWHRRAR